MALSSYTCLYSSPPLPATTKQYPSHSTRSPSSRITIHFSLRQSLAAMPWIIQDILVLRASKPEAKDLAYEEYEVYLIQPYGLKFVKGQDGGTYIGAIADGGSADKSGKFSVGDIVIATKYFAFVFR